MSEKRKDRRVVFGRGVPTHLMAIDGTWRRASLLLDVSDSGGKLRIDGSIEGLNLKEFFLLLSSTGLAYRHCELIWINGEEIGISFIKPGDKKRRSRASMAGAAPPAS
jgi:hypothetical protein